MAFEGDGVAELRARFLELLGQVGKMSVAADELGISRARGRSWALEAGFEPVRGRRRHPRRGEYEQLRALGVPQRRAAEQVGVNQRTARDWDRGVKKSSNARTYPDGLRVDYAAGTATIGGVTSPAPAAAARACIAPTALISFPGAALILDPLAALVAWATHPWRGGHPEDAVTARLFHGGILALSNGRASRYGHHSQQRS